jgi:ankyrin repeat protein
VQQTNREKGRGADTLKRKTVLTVVLIPAIALGALIGFSYRQARREVINGALVDYVMWDQPMDVKRTLLRGADPNTRYVPRPGRTGLLEFLARAFHRGEYADDARAPTVLIRAADVSNADVVRLLLDAGADANARESGGGTALLFAARRDTPEIALLLLDHGAKVNAADNGGTTPLMAAAVSEEIYRPFSFTPVVNHRQKEVVKLLLDRGAKVNAREKEFGWTALFLVARDGYSDIVGLLLSRGADVNIKGKDGYTALRWAREQGHKEIVKMLRQAGAKE